MTWTRAWLCCCRRIVECLDVCDARAQWVESTPLTCADFAPPPPPPPPCPVRGPHNAHATHSVGVGWCWRLLLLPSRFVTLWLEPAPTPGASRTPRTPRATHSGRPDVARSGVVEGGGKNPNWGEKHRPHMGVQLVGQTVVPSDAGRAVLWVEAWDDEGSRDPELIGSGMVELAAPVQWKSDTPIKVALLNSKVPSLYVLCSAEWDVECGLWVVGRGWWV